MIVMPGLAGHGDEADGHGGGFDEFGAGFFEEEEALAVGVADGDGHFSAVDELILERLGNGVGGAGDDDGVEGSGVGPSGVSVPLAGEHLVITESSESFGGR